MANNEDQNQVAESVGTAGPSGEAGKRIEQAMSQAAEQAMAEGVTDPEEIKARKLAAREEVKQQFAQEAEEQRLENERRAQEARDKSQQ